MVVNATYTCPYSNSALEPTCALHVKGARYSMPVCCQCNASGRCKNCSCKKSGRPCVDCLPLRQGRGQNAQQSSDSAGHSPPPDLRNTEPDVRGLWHNGLFNYGPTISVERNVASLDIQGGLESATSNIQNSETNQTLAVNSVYSLPPYFQVHESTFTWGKHDGTTFAHSLTYCYAEVVQWKRNLFKVLLVKQETPPVKEITRLLRAYTEASALESVALKAVMVMPHLLLQVTSYLQSERSCCSTRATLEYLG